MYLPRYTISIKTFFGGGGVQTLGGKMHIYIITSQNFQTIFKVSDHPELIETGQGSQVSGVDLML